MSYRLKHELIDPYTKYAFTIVLHDNTKFVLPKMTSDELNTILDTSSLALEATDGKKVTFVPEKDIRTIEI